MSVPTRASGPSGTPVSALALGSWHTWDRLAPSETAETLTTAIEHGINLFDVGIYSPQRKGATDVLFAEGMHRAGIARDRYRLAVKGWLPHDADELPNLLPQVDELLDRQNTDRADFLVLGDLMHGITFRDELLKQLESLIASGKVANWAVNNWSADDIFSFTRSAVEAGLPRPEYAQLKYGPARRSVAESDLLRSLGVSIGLTIQASDTFEGGLLLGSQAGRMIGGDLGGIQASIRASVTLLREVAAELGGTAAQLAIAVPLCNPQVSSVLVGARTQEQVLDNIGAFALIERVGVEGIRRAAHEFWFDKGIVDPASSWGIRPDDDPHSYTVSER
ncbi:MAG: aldo/keto reductase [Salinibacterium sp.]|nr:aldo/keto reductase [Salinibacterium sp.]